ncbi:Phage Nucleoside Triphosphate Pyrophosphohydrolase MazG-related protein [Xanthomonas phage Suba]|uniref:Phage Nucleoside Triphosphate Pyrophosphohydrolase MazG-related protein n=1 Tax=Xanthomonas phage Suba TaxID=2674975 RepID=A0A679K3Z0_9CAUD|nr:Phage Nucleoside Triphosphate Pyrophosphohydrolase MazG-related protein [Xanthomonas phage Suba]CAA2409809.1 Phage Nucleoside Triphosphate Pyrophosphohydrolase MazG-related protein [Xanthomonas phage Suba]
MTDAKPPFHYQAEAAVTLSNNFHGGAIPARLLRNVLEWLIQNGNHADELKKAIFYGRDLQEYERYADEPNCMFIGEKICPGDAVRGETIFHAIIGKITEATELGELLYGVLFKDKEFDATNFVEEIGDGLWYDAAGLSAVGMTFDEAQRINIAKLRKRFPDKFNEFDANNRDLFGERVILEERTSKRVGVIEEVNISRVFGIDKPQA